MIFSFIIISYNREADTMDAIKSVLALHDYDNWQKEIIVLNNGSTRPYNEIEKYIQDEVVSPVISVKYINSKINHGVSGGRNLAYKQATGEYLFFLDDDAEILTPDAIEITIKKFNSYKNERVAIIGTAVKLLDGSYFNPIKRKSLMHKNEFLNYIFWGCGHVIKKGLFEEVGFYSDDFFYGMEEYELCYRTIDSNMSVLFTKDIEILHKVNKAGRETNSTKYGRQLQNKTLLAYIYLPSIYFYAHFVMWSLFFLLKSRVDVSLYIENIKSLHKRIQKAKKRPISKSGLQYLSKVKARLWY